ncbi:hypothetical protein PInf_024136 [Phytophthora infestans]|nr:hypothetical protein PInf_024136 [Phytophthora infestans]
MLPNAVYYPDGTDNLEIGAVTNILVFAALEIASLHLFLQRKLSLSPLYQLAFALETQVCLVQAALFVEILLLLQYDSSLLAMIFPLDHLHQVAGPINEVVVGEKMLESVFRRCVSLGCPAP